MENSREIVPINKERENVFTVSSGQPLFEYLTGNLSLPNSRVEFSPNLNLDGYSSFLTNLYKKRKVGYVFSQNERDEMTKKPEDVSFETVFQETAKAFYEKNKDFADIKAHTERCRVLFAGEGNKIKSTRIVHGEFTNVLIGPILLKAYRSGKLLTEVHTHPEDSLLSPIDYQALISEVKQERLMKASIVLCPGIQILAIATPQTPLLQIEDTGPYINQKVEAIKKCIDPRISTVFGRHQRLTDITSKFHVSQLGKVFEEMKALQEKEARGELTKQEVEAELAYLLEKGKIESDAFGEKLARVSKKTSDKAWATSNKLEEALNLEIARELNIKLYYSTNFRDFKEFSA